MPAYFAARLSVKDPDALAEYSRKAAPIISKFNGKLLFKGGAADNLVGQLEAPNIAVFEFAEKAQIEAFFASDEYKALTALREKGADMVLSAHEGAQ